MAGETSALANVEEHVEEENPVENMQDLVKQKNDKINQIVTQLQFLMEWVVAQMTTHQQLHLFQTKETHMHLARIMMLESTKLQHSCSSFHKDLPSKVANLQKVVIRQT